MVSIRRQILTLENCKEDNKILKCEISRENIDMGYNRDNIFRLIYMLIIQTIHSKFFHLTRLN